MSKLKIGIGEWKMRNGKKAVVAAIRDGARHSRIGWIEGFQYSQAWQEDGRDLSTWNSDYDLISPWTSPIATGHNPDKLTEEQVGVSEGWRLLDEDEILKPYKGIERVGHVDCWTGQWQPGNRGICKASTYRTRLSRSELAALDKPKKRLIRVEELPSVCWVTDGAGSSLITGRHEDNVWSHQGVRHSILAMANLGLKWSSDLRTWNSFEVEDK